MCDAFRRVNKPSKIKMTADKARRMSDADRAGFQARSPEGHAARSMSIKGQEEVWVRIQANTFKNWVNVNLSDGEPARLGKCHLRMRMRRRIEGISIFWGEPSFLF